MRSSRNKKIAVVGVPEQDASRFFTDPVGALGLSIYRPIACPKEFVQEALSSAHEEVVKLKK